LQESRGWHPRFSHLRGRALALTSVGVRSVTVCYRTPHELSSFEKGRALRLALPYTPFASLLGFTPLPFTYLLVIFGIVVLYFISAELTKRWFYTNAQNHDE
jgi:hypothetical protein